MAGRPPRYHSPALAQNALAPRLGPAGNFPPARRLPIYWLNFAIRPMPGSAWLRRWEARRAFRIFRLLFRHSLDLSSARASADLREKP